MVHRSTSWGTTCGNIDVGLATKDDMDCMECVADLPPDSAQLRALSAQAFERELSALDKARAR